MGHVSLPMSFSKEGESAHPAQFDKHIWWQAEVTEAAGLKAPGCLSLNKTSTVNSAIATFRGISLQKKPQKHRFSEPRETAPKCVLSEPLSSSHSMTNKWPLASEELCPEQRFTPARNGRPRPQWQVMPAMAGKPPVCTRFH